MDHRLHLLSKSHCHQLRVSSKMGILGWANPSCYQVTFAQLGFWDEGAVTAPHLWEIQVWSVNPESRVHSALQGSAQIGSDVNTPPDTIPWPRVGNPRPWGGQMWSSRPLCPALLCPALPSHIFLSVHTPFGNLAPGSFLGCFYLAGICPWTRIMCLASQGGELRGVCVSQN